MFFVFFVFYLLIFLLSVIWLTTTYVHLYLAIGYLTVLPKINGKLRKTRLATSEKNTLTKRRCQLYSIKSISIDLQRSFCQFLGPFGAQTRNSLVLNTINPTKLKEIQRYVKTEGTKFRVQLKLN